MALYTGIRQLLSSYSTSIRARGCVRARLLDAFNLRAVLRNVAF